ncbi:hypothetical protein EVAR_30029_1 [Eumeta japonica]|uniref:Uncharacterized protein n=1 Tax=Eumeta variegata TaxID=151549 RepID=A0A4C1VTB7_EUMVA|nr:hypothetical protein EVAR_30029_1 [Eumeta japonica]
MNLQSRPDLNLNSGLGHRSRLKRFLDKQTETGVKIQYDDPGIGEKTYIIRYTRPVFGRISKRIPIAIFPAVACKLQSADSTSRRRILLEHKSLDATRRGRTQHDNLFHTI